MSSITLSIALIPQDSSVASGGQMQLGGSQAQLPQTTSSATTSGNATPSTIPSSDATGMPLPPTGAAQPDLSQLQREEALTSAQTGISRIQAAPPAIEKLNQVVDISLDATNALNSFTTTWGSLLQKIELFVDVADELAEVRFENKLLRHVLTDPYRHPEDPPLREDGMFHSVGSAKGKQRNSS